MRDNEELMLCTDCGDLMTTAELVNGLCKKCRSIGETPNRKGKLDYEGALSHSVLHMRHFDTGATRDTDEGKLDYEGALSHSVLQRYAEYMLKHCTQADGGARDCDNWQKGIPKVAYMKSMFRHFMDVWLYHRGGSSREALEESLCALLFNVMGYFHEFIKENEHE